MDMSRGPNRRLHTQQSICIFGFHIGNALQGNVIGGAELQLALLARAMADHAIPVTVFDPEMNCNLQLGPFLTVNSLPGWYQGFRALRVFTTRIPRLLNSLTAVGAGLYCTRGLSFLSLVVLLAARRSNARYALAMAADTEVEDFRARWNRSYKGDHSLWRFLSTALPNEIALPILKRCADVLFVQNDYQFRRAISSGRQVIRLNNLIDDTVFSISPSVSRKDVVIVGALSARKSLDYLVPVVKELQHIKFNFIGRVEDPAGDSVRRELSILQNVVLHGQMGRVQTLQAMAAAKVLVNTSLAEGFPNTFLEAWVLGTPVISLFVDPGGVIEANRLGYVCQGNLERFRSLIRQASYDIDLDHCRQYVLTNHSAAHAVDTIRSVLAG